MEKNTNLMPIGNEPQDKVLTKLGPIVFKGFVQHLGKFAYCHNFYCHMSRYIPFKYQCLLFWGPGARDASVTSTLQDSYFQGKCRNSTTFQMYLSGWVISKVHYIELLPSSKHYVWEESRLLIAAEFVVDSRDDFFTNQEPYLSCE